MKRFILAVSIIALLVSGCGNDASSSMAVGDRARAGDVCALFTAGEMARLVGAQVNEGRPLGSGEGCRYTAADSEVRPTAITINVSNGDSAEAMSRSREAARSSADQVRVLPGIGDEAFAYSSRSALLQSAEARQGSTRTRVLMEGLGSNPGTAATLLQQVRSRLAG